MHSSHHRRPGRTLRKLAGERTRRIAPNGQIKQLESALFQKAIDIVKCSVSFFMKALVLKRYGGAEPLAFADVARPTIGPDDILVKVRAAGLNPIDNMNVQPRWESSMPAPQSEPWSHPR